MTNLKCGMCGSLRVLGPTHANGGNNHSAVSVYLEFHDPTGRKRNASDVRRASVCVDCGHVALFVSESVRLELLEEAKGLQPVVDSSVTPKLPQGHALRF
jgi:hypothetical protein